MEVAMPTVEIDFETFKEITARRTDETVSEGDVIRAALGLPSKCSGEAEADSRFWVSEGVKFRVGTELSHTFRDGRTVVARVTESGLEFDGKVFGGLSPAGVAAAGYQLNGWRFWFVRNSSGRWVTADTLRG
jgi:hypothetical protein